MNNLDNINNILDYWYHMEFFTPFWPENNEKSFFFKDFNRETKRLPWFNSNTAPNKANKEYCYDVFVGDTQCYELILHMLSVLNLADDTVEKHAPKCILFSFKVSQRGYYIPGSLCISSLIWAVCQIIKKKNIRAVLSPEEFEKFTQSMNLSIANLLYTPEMIPIEINYAEIISMQEAICDRLSLDLKNVNDYLLCNQYLIDAIPGADNTTPSQDSEQPPSSNMLSSFYINDILEIKNYIESTDTVIKYITSLSSDKNKRIEIDREIETMQSYLHPEKFPLGKWPSKYSPCLMQQLAINIAIENPTDNPPIFSVNGPPGTGKTTLLKEIIASNIVDRAALLVQYDHPDNAFLKHTFSNPPSNYLKNYYQPNDELTIYGMLVASNNNAAVENISRELPLANKTLQEECNTPLFDISSSSDIYFTKVANSLSGEGTHKMWGLISARLGKQSNIQELKKALWFDKEVSLKAMFDKDIPDWNSAQKQFRKKYKQVQLERKKIIKSLNETQELNTYIQQIEQLKLQLERSQKSFEHVKQTVFDEVQRLTAMKNKYESMKAECSGIEGQAVRLEESIHYFSEDLPFLHRYLPSLFKNSENLAQIRDLKKQKAELNLELNAKEQALRAYVQSIEKQNSKVQEAQHQVALIRAESEQIKEEISKLKAQIYSCSEHLKVLQKQFGNNFADNAFWSDIQNNQLSQVSCPWTNKTYDTLREELFYEALALQKAFILNSKSIKKNINCLVNLWSSAFNQKDRQAAYASLLNTLFFIVPVVSTTFASVSNFLDGIGHRQLGTLIIDEAGQATPQSALGAIWRTKKTIVVGDPLQVEPIVTVPEELRKRFCEEYELEPDYRVKELSVQSLADAMNLYGGYRDYSGDQLWLGCPLVVHRRCLDPMFGISNEIAYNNRMFQETAPPKDNVLLSQSKSCWIDVKGSEMGGKNHFVQAQCDIVLNLVQCAIESASGCLPDMYIISPFTTVIYGLKPPLFSLIKRCIPNLTNKEISTWLSVSCGTVHTFQGKEANEVLLVLGCDGKSGVGAAAWAGSKPNILNVAVSRAKYRLTIIGDKDLWKTVPYFNTAIDLLE